MGKAFLKNTADLLQKKHKRKQWQKIMISLSLVVALLTSCLLIHPAITMSRQATCGQEEHTHTEKCYEKKLICNKEEQSISESSETEGEESVEAHTHSDACYENVLICGKQEHTHSEACYPKEEEKKEEVAANTEEEKSEDKDVKSENQEDKAEEKTEDTEKAEARTLKVDQADYTVEVDCPAEANIPKDAKLKVREIKKDSDEYQDYYEKALKAVASGDETDISFARFFDISFEVDGKEIEPEAKVEVKITYDDKVEVPEKGTVKSVHFGNKTEVLDVKTNEKNGKMDEVKFDADSFSVYAIVGTETITTEFLSVDGNTYEVTVTYGPDAEIPGEAKLIVTEYAEGTEEFAKAKEALIGNAVDNDNGWFYPELREENYVAPAFVGGDGGISLLDISIVDKTGIEIEPKAPVSVMVKMKELPADTETDVLENSMELKHFVENEDNDTVEVESLANTVNTYGVTGGEITVSNDSVVAEFDTESFSLFAFTWGSRTANVIVHYVDVDGNEIQGTQTSDVSISQDNAAINFSIYEGGITDYTFKEARLGTLTGDVVTGFVTTNNNTSTVTFRNGSMDVESRTVPFNAEVYFIYTPDDHPSGGDEGDNVPKPTTEKKLEPAGDGTYTLSLSVTGKKNTSTENTKANVLVIYDTSNSMEDNVAINDYLPTGGNNGRYGLVDGKYVQLYYYKNSILYTGYRKITNGITTYENVFIDTGGNNYTPYTGNRYNYYGNGQRHYVSQAAVRELADALLSNNTSDVPDMVEMALIEFDSIAYRINGGQVSNPGSKTTSYSTFADWVNKIKIPGSTGGTNWEDALTYANNYSFGDNDPVYIVFVSDGNPTYRIDRNGSTGSGGANSSTTVSGNGRNDVKVYGTGGDDPGDFNLDAAVKMATSIIKNNKHLYSVGTFGNAGKMQALAGAYYDASDPASLNRAFAEIVKSITNSLTLANVSITDGLTSMSATTFVQGSGGNFIYHKGNQVWTPEEMAAEGANEATVITAEDGTQTVKWNLGENYKLEDNVTYKVEFTVWPKQEAYDLLADLNNGLIAYDSLDENIKKQIIKNGNTYTVLTNTDASITYDVVLEEDGTETGRQPGSATITNPTNGMGLDESHLDVRKDWNDTLDPQQLLNLLDSDPNYSVVLHIKNDNNEYVPVTIKPVVTRGEDGKATSATWPTEKVFIAPGVMLSVDKAIAKGINTDNYKKVTYNETTYVILESGHDYSIDEQNTDYHFELRAETYHPMVVDGTVCNVSFTYDGTGAINGITAIDTTNTGTIVATNELRAGINMRKVVLDANGNEIYPESQTFKLKVSLKDKTGKAIKFSDYQGSATSEYFKPDGTKETVGIDGDTYPIWFNIYSGANDDMDLEKEYDDSAISDGMVVEDGGYIFLKAGEVIRFANVPIGTQFSFVEEDVPAGYDFTKYEYKAGKANQNWTTEETQTNGYGDTAIANQSYYLMITNTKKVIDVRINKKDQEGKTCLKDAKFDLYPENAVDNDWKLKTGQTPVTGYTDLVTDNNGQVTLHKVPMGTYFLVEKEAPAGFNLLEKAVKIEVTTEGVKFTQSDKNGGSTQNAEATEVDGVLTYDIIVINDSGVELPMTGGSGTLPYTLGGLMLMSAAALMYGFIMRRRGRRLN